MITFISKSYREQIATEFLSVRKLIVLVCFKSYREHIDLLIFFLYNFIHLLSSCYKILSEEYFKFLD
jgi:hypothetical protein